MVMAARAGDPHVCPMFDGPKPHVGGPILPPCSVNVLTNMKPQARITDLATCASAPDTLLLGCFTVLVNNLMAVRVGDVTMHGGNIVLGCPTVLIGAGGGGGAASASGGEAVAQSSGSSTLSTILSSAAATIAPAQQAAVYKAAARAGAPFCERCSA